MADYKKMISALRCSASVCDGRCDENCPYRTLEEITPDFPLKADFTINGIGYWESCDCDRMILDAADAIEQLVKERDAAIADLRYQSSCWNCAKNGKDCHANMPMEQPNVMCGGFEWRGVQEADHDRLYINLGYDTPRENDMEIDMNYCPVCGRKLTEVEHETD